MPAKRPPAVQKKAYVEIDYDALQTTGEIKIVSEPIVAPTITTKVPRGKFEITYTAELFGILEKLGNKKIQVLSYLLDHKDERNQINMTYPQLMKATGTSRQTVASTLSILSNAGLISRQNSVIMISPGLMVKGNQMREAYLMRRYQEMDQEIIDIQENAIDVEVNEQLEFTQNGAIVQRAK